MSGTSGQSSQSSFAYSDILGEINPWGNGDTSSISFGQPPTASTTANPPPLLQTSTSPSSLGQSSTVGITTNPSSQSHTSTLPSSLGQSSTVGITANPSSPSPVTPVPSSSFSQSSTVDDADAQLKELRQRFEALNAEQTKVTTDSQNVPMMNMLAFCDQSTLAYQNLTTSMEKRADEIDKNLKTVKLILMVFLISAILVSLAYLIWLIVILTTDPETGDPEGTSFATTYNPITYYTQRARAAKSNATTHPQGMRQRASTASRRARRTSRR